MAFLDEGLLSDSPENPQLSVALDTLVEPSLIMLDYCRETISLSRAVNPEGFHRALFNCLGINARIRKAALQIIR